MSKPERFDELLSRYLDGALEASEQAELRQWLSQPECAERFLEMTKLNAEIAGLLAAPVPDEVMAELVLSDIRRREVNDEVLPDAPIKLKEDSSPRSFSRRRVSEWAQPAVTDAQWELSPPQPRGMAPFHPVASLASARRPLRQKQTLRVLKWAAVLVALLATAAVYFLGGWHSAETAVLTAVQGQVYFIDSAGQSRLAGKQSLNKSGKLKTVGKESRAVIVLGDGTRVEMGGDSVLATELARDKPRLYLEDGSLESQIVKQPVDRPLTFATADAEAIVKGTALSLVTWKHHTRVEVTEGEVLVKRLEDGEELIVHAGYHVLIAPNVKLIPGRNEPAPKHR